MFLIFDTIVLFVIFGNSVHDFSEVIGNYPNITTINDKSCGISLFSSDLKGCFKYHNDLPLNLKDARNAIPGEAPWSAFLVFSFYDNGIQRWICGGVLIDKQWIMTAANCFTDLGNPNAMPVRVHLNPVITKEYVYRPAPQYGLEVDLSHQYLHPNFTPNNPQSSSNIALLKLNDSAPIKPGDVNSICLPPERNFTYFEEQYAMTTGWNTIGKYWIPKSVTRLQIASMKVSSHTNLRPNGTHFSLRLNGTHFIWPGYVFGKKLDKQKLCLSDRGSPVWQYHLGRAVLIGIISNPLVNMLSDNCQDEEFVGYYPNNTLAKGIKEAVSYITWVPMVMGWVQDVMNRTN